MNKALRVLLAITFFIFAMLLRLHILSMTWQWFLVPLGLPNLSLAQLAGISIILSMFNIVRQDRKIEESGAKWDIVWEFLGKNIGQSLALWLMAWIAYLLT